MPDQPFGDDQTLLGAYNRLACLAANPANAGSLLCAIEGGVGWAAPAPHGLGALQQRQGGEQQRRQLECFAWAVVQAPGGRASHARSASFLLPPAITKLMLTEGLELGAADDRLWGRCVGAIVGCKALLMRGARPAMLLYLHAMSDALLHALTAAMAHGCTEACAAAAGIRSWAVTRARPAPSFQMQRQERAGLRDHRTPHGRFAHAAELLPACCGLRPHPAHAARLVSRACRPAAGFGSS